MQSGLYVALSSQIALERRLTTVADNIANMNTAGFRSTEVKFDEVMARTGGDLNASVAFVSQGNDYLNTRQGGFVKTDNPLDVTIRGDAWFAIETPAGQALTRDGRFSLTPNGDLVSSRGYPVLDAGGAPIQLDRTAGAPDIGADGRIYQAGRVVGSLGLFQADLNPGYLRYDNSGILTTSAAQPVVDRHDVSVLQGYVEELNVNAIGEMTQLIQVNRAFEGISSLIRDSENSFSEAIKTLGGSR